MGWFTNIIREEPDPEKGRAPTNYKQIRYDLANRHRNTDRIRESVGNHPFWERSCDTIMIGGPLLVTLLKAVAFIGSPSYFSYGTLVREGIRQAERRGLDTVMRRATDSGTLTFGGLGYCTGDAQCVKALWYKVDDQFVPDWANYVPTLILWLNVAIIPFIFIWWGWRWLPFIRQRYRNFRRNKRSHVPAPRERDWEPSEQFRIYEVIFVMAVCALIIALLGVSLAFIASLTGAELNAGFYLNLTGDIIYGLWTYLRWRRLSAPWRTPNKPCKTALT